MHIQISLDDGIPIYRQIVNQVKYMVASGQLISGEEIPPIRVLAERIHVTPNTVAKAYRELEVEGVVGKRRGSGSFIADTRSQLARNERRRIVKQRAEALLIESRQMNFTFERTIEILRQCEAALCKETTKEHADER